MFKGKKIKQKDENYIIFSLRIVFGGTLGTYKKFYSLSGISYNLSEKFKLKIFLTILINSSKSWR